ncbi:hypothetical protein KKE54_02405 [bacterium]|nr:hypothetical protein [bacterium]
MLFTIGRYEKVFRKKIFLVTVMIMFAAASAFIVNAEGGESAKGIINQQKR